MPGAENVVIKFCEGSYGDTLVPPPPPPIHTHTRTHRQLSPLLSTNFCCTNGGPLVLCRTQTPPSAAGGEKSKPPPAWQHGSSDLC